MKNSAKQLIEDKIRGWKIEHKFRIRDHYIETPWDGLIIFQGMKNHTSDSVKSFEGYDGAWAEEASRLTKRSIDLLYPTIRKDNSELWFSWNPEKPTDPVEVFQKSVGDDGVGVKVTYRDNPFLPEVMRIDMERDRRRDPDKYKHIWLGGYNAKSHARVFTNVRIGDPSEFEGLQGRRYYGADFGFAKDPTVLLEGMVVGRKLYILRESYKVGLEIDHTPAKWKADLPGAEAWSIRADGARPETISYLQRHGFPRIKAATKGPGSVKEGVEFLKSFDIIIHPACQYAWDEFSTFSYKVDKLTDEVLPELTEEKNHTIDSGRYMIEELRRGRAGVF